MMRAASPIAAECCHVLRLRSLTGGGLESRLIKITPSAVTHGRLNIRSCGRDFFPDSAFGGATKSSISKTPVSIEISGSKRVILTDIPADASGRPRWFFRDRAWVKAFVREHQLQLGGEVVLTRLGESSYRISAKVDQPASTSLFAGSLTADDIPVPSSGRRGKYGDLNKLSPDDQPAHDWYRFVLSYPPHLVRDYLKRLSVTKRDRVLDPFCGTGTTIVECQKFGTSSVAVEANRMAYFAGKTKMNWNVHPKSFRIGVLDFQTRRDRTSPAHWR